MSINRIGLTAVVVATGGMIATALAAPAAAAPAEVGVTSSLAAISTASAARSTGPRIMWDWTMPSNIIDDKGWDFDSQKLSGPPDGIPDNTMEPMTTYQGNKYPIASKGQYGTIPVDGRHTVVLDATGTTGRGKVTCTWRIDSSPQVRIKNASCAQKQTVSLPEGTFNIQVKARDRAGTTKILSKITVQNTLIAVMGDSYSSGVGFPPYRVDGKTGPRSVIDWEDDGCYRSRWAGFVRAALAVEKADPRSNVTVVDVACGGAEVEQEESSHSGGGIIAAQKSATTVRPAQVDQLTKIVGDRPIDVVLLSIGGNDLGFGGIARHCLATVGGGADSCYDSIKEGDPLWEWTDKRMVFLEKEFKDMAPCLTRSAPGTCRTEKTLGGPLTPATALQVDDGSRVVQSSYPNLSARIKKPGEQGNGSKSWIYCSMKPNSSQPDADGTYGQAPLMPWDGDWATRAGYLGMPGDTFTPTDAPSGGGKVGPLKGKGLNVQLQENVDRYGYRVPMEMYNGSLDHGPCATAAGMTYWVNGFTTAIAGAPQDGAPFIGGILHPSELGQQKYSQYLTQPAKQAAGVPVRKVADQAVPGPVRKIRLKDVSRSWKVARGRLKVTWKQPRPTMGGDSVDKYRIRLSKANKPKKWNRWKVTKQPRKVFAKMNKNKRYRVAIQAHNDVGWGKERVRRVPRDFWSIGRG